MEEAVQIKDVNPESIDPDRESNRINEHRRQKHSFTAHHIKRIVHVCGRQHENKKKIPQCTAFTNFCSQVYKVHFKLALPFFEIICFEEIFKDFVQEECLRIL